MKTKPLSREELDEIRASPFLSMCSSDLLDTLDAAHEDEARALNRLLDLYRWGDITCMNEAHQGLRQAGVLR
jgi:hypothetical protein